RGRRQGEDDNHRLDEEDQREDRHGEEDVAVAPVLSELLAEDGPDAPPAHAHLSAASFSSPISSRETSSSEWCDSLIDSTSAPAATRARVTAGAASAGSDTASR